MKTTEIIKILLWGAVSLAAVGCLQTGTINSSDGTPYSGNGTGGDTSNCEYSSVSVEGNCLPDPLDYSQNVSTCDLVIQMSDTEAGCPEGTVDDGLSTDEYDNEVRECLITQSGYKQACDGTEQSNLESVYDPVWIYCEADYSLQDNDPSYCDYNIFLSEDAALLIDMYGNVSIRCCP